MITLLLMLLVMMVEGHFYNFDTTKADNPISKRVQESPATWSEWNIFGLCSESCGPAGRQRFVSYCIHKKLKTLSIHCPPYNYITTRTKMAMCNFIDCDLKRNLMVQYYRLNYQIDYSEYVIIQVNSEKCKIKIRKVDNYKLVLVDIGNIKKILYVFVFMGHQKFKDVRLMVSQNKPRLKEKLHGYYCFGKQTTSYMKHPFECNMFGQFISIIIRDATFNSTFRPTATIYHDTVAQKELVNLKEVKLNYQLAKQTSNGTFNKTLRIPSSAITGMCEDSDFSSTTKERNPRWWIDFEKLIFVVLIQHRSHNHRCIVRMHNIHYSVHEDENDYEFDKCAWFVGSAQTGQVINMVCRKIGRYLSIFIHNKVTILRLCDLKVFKKKLEFEEIKSEPQRTYQSPDWLDTKKKKNLPSQAIIGNCEGDDKESSTPIMMNPVWYIDFIEPMELDFITFKPGRTPTPSSFRNAYLVASNTRPDVMSPSIEEYCGYYRGPAQKEEMITIYCHRIKRFLAIVIWGKGVLKLCAVKIYRITDTLRAQVSASQESGLVLLAKDLEHGYICNSDFGKNEAEVLCRMMGFTNLYHPRVVHFHSYEFNEVDTKDPDLDIILSGVKCSGYESNIDYCKSDWPRISPQCRDVRRAVGVFCEQPKVEINEITLKPQNTWMSTQLANHASSEAIIQNDCSTYSSTQKEHHPMWQADMEDVYTVSHVSITLRQEGFHKFRNVFLSVTFSNKSGLLINGADCYHYLHPINDGSTSPTIHMPCDSMGQYVNIVMVNKTQTSLEMCYVQVFIKITLQLKEIPLNPKLAKQSKTDGLHIAQLAILGQCSKNDFSSTAEISNPIWYIDMEKHFVVHTVAFNNKLRKFIGSTKEFELIVMVSMDEPSLNKVNNREDKCEDYDDRRLSLKFERIYCNKLGRYFGLQLVTKVNLKLQLCNLKLWTEHQLHEDIRLNVHLANQSSTYVPHSVWNASLAISGDCKSKFYSHTDIQDYPAWYIDLENLYLVETVQFVFKAHGTSEYELLLMSTLTKPILDPAQNAPLIHNENCGGYVGSPGFVTISCGEVSHFILILMKHKKMALKICHLNILIGYQRYADVELNLGKARQSSTDWQNFAYRAITGDCQFSNGLYLFRASKTKKEQNPLWSVDMTLNYKVEVVQVTTLEYLYDDFENVDFYLTSEKTRLIHQELNIEDRCAQYPGHRIRFDKIARVRCSRVGRHLIIQMNKDSNSSLALCQLKVFIESNSNQHGEEKYYGELFVLLYGPSKLIIISHRRMRSLIHQSVFDVKSAKIICRQMDQPSENPRLVFSKKKDVKDLMNAYDSDNKPKLLITKLNCIGSENNIGECVMKFSPMSDIKESHYKVSGVLCQADNQPTMAAKMLPHTSQPIVTTVDNKKGKICSKDFDWRDAKVLCRMMNFVDADRPQPIFHDVTYSDTGNFQFVLNGLKCIGEERNVESCPRNDSLWKKKDCPSDYKMRLDCHYDNSIREVFLNPLLAKEKSTLPNHFPYQAISSTCSEDLSDFSSTTMIMNPIWYVHLRATFLVDHVELTLRKNATARKLFQSAIIKVHSQEPNMSDYHLWRYVCGRVRKAVNQTITVFCRKMGNYLSIALKGRNKTQLQLCGVKVFAQGGLLHEIQTIASSARQSTTKEATGSKTWLAENAATDESLCSCTKLEAKPWWFIKLKELYRISLIKVQLSTTNSLNVARLREAIVDAHMESPAEILPLGDEYCGRAAFLFKDLGHFGEIRCGKIGRYLSMTLLITKSYPYPNTVLEMCRVRVYSGGKPFKVIELQPDLARQSTHSDKNGPEKAMGNCKNGNTAIVSADQNQLAVWTIDLKSAFEVSFVIVWSRNTWDLASEQKYLYLVVSMMDPNLNGIFSERSCAKHRGKFGTGHSGLQLECAKLGRYVSLINENSMEICSVKMFSNVFGRGIFEYSLEGKPAYLTTTWKNLKASLVTTSKCKDQNHDVYDFASSNLEKKPMLTVDLQEMVAITSVIARVRYKGMTSYNFNDAFLILTNEKPNYENRDHYFTEICTAFPGSAYSGQLVKFECFKKAQFVTIGLLLRLKGYLELCKVRVYIVDPNKPTPMHSVKTIGVNHEIQVCNGEFCGSVCSKGLNKNVAQVMCRMLGLPVNKFNKFKNNHMYWNYAELSSDRCNFPFKVADGNQSFFCLNYNFDDKIPTCRSPNGELIPCLKEIPLDPNHTFQTSSNMNLRASLALNKCSSESYSSTMSNQEPTWFVDMRAHYFVEFIRHVTRADKTRSALFQNATYHVTAKPPNMFGKIPTVCGKFAGPASPSQVIIMKCEALGRYVSIRLNSITELELCSIKIFSKTKYPLVLSSMRCSGYEKTIDDCSRERPWFEPDPACKIYDITSLKCDKDK